jgi:hypothetical protein
LLLASSAPSRACSACRFCGGRRWERPRRGELIVFTPGTLNRLRIRCTRRRLWINVDHGGGISRCSGVLSGGSARSPFSRRPSHPRYGARSSARPPARPLPPSPSARRKHRRIQLLLRRGGEFVQKAAGLDALMKARIRGVQGALDDAVLLALGSLAQVDQCDGAVSTALTSLRSSSRTICR